MLWMGENMDSTWVRAGASACWESSAWLRVIGAMVENVASCNSTEI